MKVKSPSSVLAAPVVAWTLALVWLGCVGDAPTTTPTDTDGGGGKAPGTLGGACFPNSTCNGGFDCFEDVCIPHDTGGTSGGTSGGVETDGGTGDGGDGGHCAPFLPPTSTGPTCGNVPSGCPAGRACCNLDGGGGLCATDSDGGCPTSSRWTCAASNHCNGTIPRCCLRTTVSLSATCPRRATESNPDAIASCNTVAQCDLVTNTALCSTDLECGEDKHCVPVLMKRFGVDAYVGICQ